MNLLARASAAALLLLGMPSIAHVAGADGTAMELALKFCAARVADDEDAVRAILSPGLLQAIEEAEQRNAVLERSNPGEKPPLGDGVPYQAYPDLAPKCEPGVAEKGGGRITIPVRYVFPDQPNGDWTDRLLVTKDVKRGFVVDDILFSQFPTDSEQYGLRRTLRQAFDH